MGALRRARKIERALVATLSGYLQAIIAESGVTLLRDKRTTWIAADEMDRLCEEWRRFRAEPAVERRAEEAGP